MVETADPSRARPPMISVRIVSTYDGVKTAETLARLLAAEEHPVKTHHARSSLEQLDVAKADGDAVILVWSVDAPMQSYMRRWADEIDPARLVEIARSQSWPPSEKRRYPVIDFSSWNGGRGGSSWRLLTERLRTVARSMEPAKPQPVRAAAAVLMVGVVAVGAAAWQRAQAPEVTPAAPPAADAVVAEAPAAIPSGGVGGPLRMEEPASLDDQSLLIEPTAPRARLLDAPKQEELIRPEVSAPMEFHDASLMQRLSSLAAPLLRGDEDDDSNEIRGTR